MMDGKLRDVLPRPPFEDGSDQRGRHPKSSCYLLDGLSRGDAAGYPGDGIFRQFGISVSASAYYALWFSPRALSASSRVTILFNHVSHVVLGFSQPQVSRIAAPSIGPVPDRIPHVARVAREKRIRIGACRKKIGNSMRLEVPIVDLDSPISPFVNRGHVEPAVIGAAFIKVSPKSVGVLLGQRRKWLTIWLRHPVSFIDRLLRAAAAFPALRGSFHSIAFAPTSKQLFAAN